MDLYLAGLGSSKRMMKYVLEFNEGKPFEEQIGIMCTFAQPNLFHKAVQAGFKKIFLDSGAFTVFNSGGEVDIDELIFFIKKNQENIYQYISLDVISDKVGFESMRNWDYMREQGLEPIPVYHAGEEWSVLEHYCEYSNYICVGGMAGVSSNWMTWVDFLQAAFLQFPDHKFHALGVNDPQLAKRFPFYSVDALSWRSGSRFGQVITPWGRWWISGRNKKSSSPDDLDKMGILDWLEEKGIPYPIPEGYDFNLLDELNIRTLYDEIVKFHHEEGHWQVPYTISIF